MKLSSLVFSVLTLALASTGSAAEDFLNVFFQVQAGARTSLIAPPPAPGSAQDLADFKELHYWQATRTRSQCEAANREVNIFLRTFIGSRTDLLSAREELKLTKDVSLMQLQVAAITMDLKNRYNRPRPYEVDPTLKPCLPLETNSSAYPSGHASSAYAIAEMLSSILPARSKLFFERAQEIAFNRMLGGVHHRTDIVAGEKVGRYYGRRARWNLR